jgi:glycosyltransferase involved in cell wall biosynthesis
MSGTFQKAPLYGRPLRLVFYDDASVYGGHEVMILNALRHLVQLDAYEIVFIYSASNDRLGAELKLLQANCPKLSLVPFSYASGKLQFLRTLWAVGPQRGLRKVLRSICPNCLIIVQGEIGLSSLGVLSGVRESIRTISYIPLAHSRQQRGERCARAKDAILRGYYRLPNHFITISSSTARMLRERGVQQAIDIVENGIDFSAFHPIDKADARAQLGISKSKFVAALCGRIEFQQKGHDVLLRALAKRSRDFTGWTFLIVGDGPDRHRLGTIIEELKIGHIVKLIAWQSSMSAVYSAIDMVVMPSRFEGVPVALLEAMYFGIPIVASAIDAMADILPDLWLFPAGDDRALADVMLRVRSMDNNQLLENNRRLVASRFTIERQGQEFALALNRYIDPDAEAGKFRIGERIQVSFTE